MNCFAYKVWSINYKYNLCIFNICGELEKIKQNREENRMRRKIVSIFVCMLLIATTMVFVPKENVKAEGGGGEDSNEMGLNYDYLWEQINRVADVIWDAYQETDLKKGRQFGSAGDKFTWHDILIPEMENMSLDDVHEEKMQHIDGIDRYYTSLIDIGGFNLTVNNNTYAYNNNIPKSEVFPVARATRKWDNGELTHDFTTFFNNAEIKHYNFRNNFTPLFNGTYSISNYYSINNKDNYFLFGNLTYIAANQSAPAPGEQQGRVYLFYENETNQDLIDNLTDAAGCVIINTSKGLSLNLSKTGYEVKKTNQSSGDDVKEILENYSIVIIDDIFGNLQISYDLDTSNFPGSDYVVIDRIPDHYELQNDTSGLLLYYANGSTPTLVHYLACYTTWLFIFSWFPNCQGFILYSSFDHHIMIPTYLKWDDVTEEDVGHNGPNIFEPTFCVNYTLGALCIKSKKCLTLYTLWLLYTQNTHEGDF